MRPLAPLRSASSLLGAFALALLAFTPACKKQPVPWEGKTVAEETAAIESEAAKPALSTPAAKPDAPSNAVAGELRFVAYNLENWLTMDRYVDGKAAGSTSKPESERNAVISILTKAQPDILGFCEIGTEVDLADLQARLKSAGIDLPHAHHTGGVDDTRHLGLLSRFPITSTVIHKDLDYDLEGNTRGMSRGILDATVAAPQGELRFLGVHLKSKREIPEADQAEIRLQEAHLLRLQANSVLTENPEARLIVFGDMNDTRQTPALRAIKGPRDGPLSLKMAFLRDSRGETWTQHWSYQDVYSRFDYIFISPPLVKEIEWDSCRVLDDPEWADASDHRALLFILKP